MSSNRQAAQAADDDSEDARQAAHSLAIRQVLANSAQSSEPEALMVVVEALTARQEPVEPQGQISLMVMTSDAPGSWKRIERWDFTSDEAASSWQSTSLGDGFHLQLPFTTKSLPQGAVEVWARLVLKSGDKLLTKLPVDLKSLSTLDDALAAAESPQFSRTPDDNASDDGLEATATPLPSLIARAPESSAVHRQGSDGPSASGLASQPLRSRDLSSAPSSRSQSDRAATTKSEWRAATTPFPIPRRSSTAGLGSSTTASPAGNWATSSVPSPAILGARRASPPSGEDAVKPGGASPQSAPRWQPFR